MVFRVLLIITIFFGGFCLSKESLLDIQNVKSRYGIDAYLVERPESQIAVATMIFKNSGYAYDPQEKQGISHLMSIILEDGPQNQSKADYSAYLASIGAKISFKVDQDNFYCSVYAIRENFDKAIELLCNTLLSPKINDNRIKEAAKLQISRRSSAKNDTNYLAKSAFFSKSFGKDGYGSELYGSEESIKSICTNDLLNFASNAFHRVNFSINFVGNLSKYDVIDLLDKHIVELPLTTMEIRAANFNGFNGGGYTEIEAKNAQNTIFFGRSGCKIGEKNFFNLKVLNYILGGSGIDSLLSNDIRKASGYSYGVKTDLINFDGANAFVGYVKTVGKNADDVINIIKKRIEKVKLHGLSEDEIILAKQNLKNELIVNLDGVIDLSEYLRYIQSRNLGKDYLHSYIEGILGVNIESLNRFASSFLDLDEFNFVNVGQISKENKI